MAKPVDPISIFIGILFITFFRVSVDNVQAAKMTMVTGINKKSNTHLLINIPISIIGMLITPQLIRPAATADFFISRSSHTIHFSDKFPSNTIHTPFIDSP